MLGATEQEIGYLGVRKPRVVSIQNGLPPELFMSVLVHELTHVWVSHTRFNLPEIAEEGICTWVSYYFLRGLAGSEARYQAGRIERNTDPIYSQGFQRFSTHAGGAGPAELPRLISSFMQKFR